MKQKSKRKNQNRSLLQKKLKSAVQNLNVDVFGYERKVSKNVNRYLDGLSKQTGITKNKFRIKIFKGYYTHRVCVVVKTNKESVKTISIPELITLFTNMESTSFLDLESKVEAGIKEFLEEFATAHGIHVKELQVFIQSTGSSVSVKAFDGRGHLEDIPIATLIKQFMP